MASSWSTRMVRPLFSVLPSTESPVYSTRLNGAPMDRTSSASEKNACALSWRLNSKRRPAGTGGERKSSSAWRFSGSRQPTVKAVSGSE